MRPRVFPAEDGSSCQRNASGSTCFNEAAGIPRGRPGVVLTTGVNVRASMRPRVFPAEDP